MGNTNTVSKTDFSQGAVWKRILAQGIPLTIAQLVHLLYNIVDRIYIGHMGDGSSIALTGVGLTFPITTIIMAFTVLFGNGGVPLFSMRRGAGEEDKAGKIMGTAFAMLVLSSVILTLAGYLFAKPVLYAFGASDASYVYAKEYLNIYLIGTIFSMVTTGMNGYINAQGFPRIGMLSVVIGAIINIILDPVFIFLFDMGVSGAALATVISQVFSAVWVMWFLLGKKAIIPLEKQNIRFAPDIIKDITKLGTANFIMQGTTCLVQVMCNSTLQRYGGDVYVGIMTVINSVREIFLLPISGIGSGSIPVISFNYGAKKYSRAIEGIRFNTLVAVAYSLFAWALVILFPKFWFGIFSNDIAMIDAGVSVLKIYFFGFFIMAFQFSGQNTFQSLGDAKHAIFFSLLRKAIIVAPLTVLLPALGFGVKGVFLAEPISNVIGGLACYITMRMTAYKKLQEADRKLKSKRQKSRRMAETE